eukprot:jgi/Botrbrau1/21960/Bobra.0249s0083.1
MASVPVNNAATGNVGQTLSIPPTPQQVGEQFVSQYYHVKHHNPQYLHRFYNDTSRIMIYDPQDPLNHIYANGQKAIGNVFSAAKFAKGKSFIESTQSQGSLAAGVLVAVTGTIELVGKPKRLFSQAFFLAVQEKGFFVLNDIFTYINPLPQAPDPLCGIPNVNVSHAMVSGPTSAPLPSHGAPFPPGPSYHGAPVAAPLAPTLYSAKPTVQGSSLPMPPAAEDVRTLPVLSDTSKSQIPTDRPRETLSTSEYSSSVNGALPAPAAVPASIDQTGSRSSVVGLPTAEATSGMRLPDVSDEIPANASEIAADADYEEKVSTAPEVVTAPPEPQPKPKAEPAPEPEKATKSTFGERSWAEAVKISLPKGPQPPKPSSTESAAVPKVNPRPAIPAHSQPTAPSPSVPATNGLKQNGGGRHNQIDADEEQASIFVNHIPEGIEAPRLLDIFSVFGNIRNGVKGIKVKPQRGKDTYAFIDFDTAAAVEKSVAAPPVIDGKQLHVSRKRPQFAGMHQGYSGRGAGRGMHSTFRGGGRGGRGAPFESAAGPENGNGFDPDSNGRHTPPGSDANGARAAVDPADTNGGSRNRVMGRGGDSNGYNGFVGARGRGGRGGRGDRGRGREGRGFGGAGRAAVQQPA